MTPSARITTPVPRPASERERAPLPHIQSKRSGWTCCTCSVCTVTTAGDTRAMARVMAVCRLAVTVSVTAARGGGVGVPAVWAADDSAGPEQPA